MAPSSSAYQISESSGAVATDTGANHTCLRPCSPSSSSASQKNISMYYQNVRGLRSKTHELFRTTQVHRCDIICLTETWADDGVFNSELFDDNYAVFRSDRNYAELGVSRGGGVLIAIDSCCSATLLDTDIFSRLPNIDVISVRVCLGEFNFCVVVAYLPPLRFPSAFLHWIICLIPTLYYLVILISVSIPIMCLAVSALAQDCLPFAICPIS